MSQDKEDTNAGDPEIDYKNLDKLRQYIGETGKILPGRIRGPVPVCKGASRQKLKGQDIWDCCLTLISIARVESKK